MKTKVNRRTVQELNAENHSILAENRVFNQQERIKALYEQCLLDMESWPDGSYNFFLDCLDAIKVNKNMPAMPAGMFECEYRLIIGQLRIIKCQIDDIRSGNA